jgi:hypothetical protein
VAQEHAFDLDRGDVLAAADDHVLQAVADLDVAVGMDDGGVAGVEPSAAQGLGGGFGIVEVALHHDVPAHHDLAQGLPVGRHLDPVVVVDGQLAGGDELDALARLDRRAVREGQARVFGPRLADRDEGRGLGQAVHLGDRPAQLALDALDGGGGGRRARGQDAQGAARLRAQLRGAEAIR